MQCLATIWPPSKPCARQSDLQFPNSVPGPVSVPRQRGPACGKPALVLSVVLTKAEGKTMHANWESEETGKKKKNNKKMGSSQGPQQPNLKVLEHSMSYNKEKGLCFLRAWPFLCTPLSPFTPG